MAAKKINKNKSKTTKKAATNDGRWGNGNARLSRDPIQLLARFQEQEAVRYEKICRIANRAEKLGDKKTATAAKKVAKKLQSFARA